MSYAFSHLTKAQVKFLHNAFPLFASPSSLFSYIVVPQFIVNLDNLVYQFDVASLSCRAISCSFVIYSDLSIF